MMRPSPTIASVSVAALGALLGLLGPSGSASAAPPTADQFQIIYYVEDGDQQRIMTANELNYWANQARCECGSEIEARIRLQGSFDNVQVRTYVGTRCDEALQVVGQFDPCVRALDEFANAYTKTSSVFFGPVWLVSGVADRNNDTLESATPSTACDAGTGMGGGGIWICVESNNTSGCQPDEFIIKGSQSDNPSGSDGMDTGSVPGMMGGGGGSGSLQADFQPPSITVTGFRATGGDGGVEIAWDQVSTTDVNGFRVLCADASGNPVPGKGITPSTNEQNLGTVYFTADNLCSGDDPPDDGETTGTSTSGGTGDGTGDGTGGGGTQGAIDGDPHPQHGGFPATTSGDGTITATSTATGGGTGGDTDGTGGFTTGTSLTGGGTGPGGGGGTMADFNGSQDTLDWDYVCSDHVPPMSSSVRVSGLENGKDYQFIVVAYDRAGNPATASEVLTATPQETTDLWEQCAQQGDICGDGGFCSCRTGPRRSDGMLWVLLGLALGVARRRRWRLPA